MLKKIFNFFGYSLTKTIKSTNLHEIIKLRLKERPQDLLLDVGANYGDFSEKLLSYFKEIHLFEPNPEIIPSLRSKFKSFSNVKIIDCGIGNENKKLPFYITNDKGKTLSSIKKQNNIIKENLKNTEIINQIEIEIKRLDSVLKNNLYKKIFLKSDTQGNDLETLESLGQFIKNVNFINIEVSIINLYENNYNHWKVLDFLKNNNFEPIFFDHGIRDKKGKLIECDILFEKQN